MNWVASFFTPTILIDGIAANPHIIHLNLIPMEADAVINVLKVRQTFKSLRLARMKLQEIVKLLKYLVDNPKYVLGAFSDSGVSKERNAGENFVFVVVPRPRLDTILNV